MQNLKKNQRKILFLYTELAGYFLSCIQKLVEFDDCKIHIIHWSINKEAPFEFNFSEKIKFYNKDNFSSKQLVELAFEISPDLIYCSGWIDNDYLKICKKFKNKIPIVVGFDNQWKNTLKQHLAVLISSFTILRYFSHCWIPGEPQYEYARRLGFKKENILKGFYSADVDLFHKHYLDNKEEKQKKIPKRFLYVGRYYQFKGIEDLWSAFIELEKEYPNDWELWGLGTGDVKPISHPKIKHLGFVQPTDLGKYIKETGVFMLPSHFEPWGVVVHEYATAGFPLICSDKVGAASAFLEDGENGYLYKSGDVNALKIAMRKMMDHTDKELFEMSNKSVEKAKQITPDKWANTLMEVINQKS